MKSDQEFINGIYEKANRYAELEQNSSSSPLAKIRAALSSRRFVPVMAPCLCALAIATVVLVSNGLNSFSPVQPEDNFGIQSTNLEQDPSKDRAINEPATSSFSIDLQVSKDQLEIMKATSSLIITGKVTSLEQEGNDQVVTIEVGECFLGTGEKQVILRYNSQEVLVPETGLPFETFFNLEEQILVFLGIPDGQNATGNFVYQLGEYGRDSKLTYIGEEDGDSIYQAANGSKIGVSQLR